MSSASSIATVAVENPLADRVEESKMTSVTLRSKSDPDTSYGRQFLLENDFMYIDEDADEVDSGYGTNKILFDSDRSTSMELQLKNSTNANNSPPQQPRAGNKEEDVEEKQTKGNKQLEPNFVNSLSLLHRMGERNQS
ncbi:hypothetical protein DMENIID0001_073670 [Sergentomyia squamirostris]